MSKHPANNPSPDPRPRVVIIGAGFAGLRCARRLKNTRAELTVIDKRNHHLFQPLLYQVATAALSPADIAAPIRSIFRNHKNTRVLLDEVTAIDTAGRAVTTDNGLKIPYDYLVLAAGANVSYFGNDEQWHERAPGLKTVKDALRVREQFLEAFELAETEPDDDIRAALLTFVVIGGGPTGVELAGTMAEIARVAIPPDFRRINPADARVVLVEGGDSLLPAYPTRLRERAKRDLERLGVTVQLNALATEINDERVTLSDGTSIDTRNVFWGAGVAPSPLAEKLGTPLADDGRVAVARDLTPEGHPEIFVAGDIARVEDTHNQRNTEVPGIAPAAIQMGEYAARQIAREIERNTPPSTEQRPPFRYRDKGMLATIGRGKAVGVVANRPVAGVTAWLLWLFVHLAFLVGFRNRAVVLVQWAYNYIFWVRGARLITDDESARQHTAIDHPNAGYALPPLS